jgi:hypothetical protein
VGELRIAWSQLAMQAVALRFGLEMSGRSPRCGGKKVAKSLQKE